MTNIESKVMELAELLKKEKLNFVIVIEDNDGIHDQMSVNGKTPVREIVKVVKSITKKKVVESK